jgi:hypothetical protein
MSNVAALRPDEPTDTPPDPRAELRDAINIKMALVVRIDKVLEAIARAEESAFAADKAVEVCTEAVTACGVSQMPMNQIAVHEAAHCVISRVLGVEVVRASIDPPCVRTKQGASEEDLERLVVIDLAAGVLDSADACVPDELNASRRCCEIVRLRHRMTMDTIMAPGIHAAIMRRLRQYAVALVHKHRPAIESSRRGTGGRQDVRPGRNRFVDCREGAAMSQIGAARLEEFDNEFAAQIQRGGRPPRLLPQVRLPENTCCSAG